MSTSGPLQREVQQTIASPKRPFGGAMFERERHAGDARRAAAAEDAVRDREGLGNGESTRWRILDAAAALFLRYGYEGTTMNRVAREVGVSAPALYWHFDSKGDLAFSFVKASLEAIVTSVESQVTADDPVEQLEQFVRAYVTFQLERGKNLPAEDTLYRHGFDQVLESLPEDDRTRLKGLQRQLYDFLGGVLESGADAGVFRFEDRSVVAQAIMTMSDYVFTWYRPGGRFDVFDVADIYARIAARMVDAHAAAHSATEVPKDT